MCRCGRGDSALPESLAFESLLASASHVPTGSLTSNNQQQRARAYLLSVSWGKVLSLVHSYLRPALTFERLKRLAGVEHSVLFRDGLHCAIPQRLLQAAGAVRAADWCAGSDLSMGGGPLGCATSCIQRLHCNRGLRWALGNNLRVPLPELVCWTHTAYIEGQSVVVHPSASALTSCS